MPASRRQCFFEGLGGIGNRRRASLCGEMSRGDSEHERQQNGARSQRRARTRAQIGKMRVGTARAIRYSHVHDFAWRKISERFAVKLDLGITCLQPAA